MRFPLHYFIVTSEVRDPITKNINFLHHTTLPSFPSITRPVEGGSVGEEKEEKEEQKLRKIKLP